MRTIRPLLLPALAAVVLGAALLPTPAREARAENKQKLLDLTWTHPAFASFGVQSIALMPVASFNHDVQAERTAMSGWGRQFQGAGYRWVSAPTVKVLLGDSAANVVQARILDHGRVDSLAAPALCARLRVAALLSLRLDRWEQMTLEFNQRGKPSTTVGITAALVDSTGALLWSISGTETAEGPEQDPDQATIGVKSSGLKVESIAQGGPPAYADVLTRLLARWGPLFPAKPAAPAAP